MTIVTMSDSIRTRIWNTRNSCIELVVLYVFSNIKLIIALLLVFSRTISNQYLLCVTNSLRFTSNCDVLNELVCNWYSGITPNLQ